MSPTSSQRSASTEDPTKHEIEPGGDYRCEPKKSWFRKLNPFFAGGIPAVPAEDAGLVPDLQASFWNKLTWGWMGPLMLVTPQPILSRFHHDVDVVVGRVQATSAKRGFVAV